MAAKVEKKSSKTTVKLIIWKQANKKGYPLKIRITKNRKTRYINLKHYLKKSDLKYISKKTGELSKSYPKYDTVKKLFKQHITINNEDEPTTNGASFYEFFESDLRKLEEREKFGTLQKTNTLKHHLKRFCDYENLKFEDINIDFLNDFQTYFLKNKISGMSQKGHFDKLKALINLSIKQDKYNPTRHPFNAFKPIKFEPNRKSLESVEFAKIQNIIRNPSKYKNNNHKDIFPAVQKALFQYYNLGMRVSDLILLKWENIIHNGTRIEYKMMKTSNVMNYKIVDNLYCVFYYLLPEKYKEKFDFDFNFDPFDTTTIREEKPDFLTQIKTILNQISKDENYKDECILQMIKSNLEGKAKYRAIQNATQKYNKELKTVKQKLKIESDLSSHVLRHTFAINAITTKKLDIYELSKALNHRSVKTTENYLRGFKMKNLDAALKNMYDDNKQDKKTSDKIETFFSTLTEAEKQKLLGLLKV